MKKVEWIYVLLFLVQGVNELVNRTIQMKPKDVSEQNNEKVFLTLYGLQIHFTPPKFRVGDLVCVSKYASAFRSKKGKLMFKKGYKSNFERDVYKVNHISRGNPNMHKLVDHEDGDKPIFSWFYQEELLLVR